MNQNFVTRLLEDIEELLSYDNITVEDGLRAAIRNAIKYRLHQFSNELSAVNEKKEE